MPRIIRALVVSAVATSAAVVVSALLKNRDSLLERSPGMETGPGEVQASADRPSHSDPIDSLSYSEEESLLEELRDHV